MIRNLIQTNLDQSTEGIMDFTPSELAAEDILPTPVLKAIRAKCVDCSGGSASEANKCTAITCPLWAYRLGKNPWRKKKTITKEHLAKLQGKQYVDRA